MCLTTGFYGIITFNVSDVTILRCPCGGRVICCLTNIDLCWFFNTCNMTVKNLVLREGREKEKEKETEREREAS